MKNKKFILASIVILITFIQGLIILVVGIGNEEESHSVISIIEEEPMQLKEIDEFLIDLMNYKVINRRKIENNWVINLKIQGTKEEIIYDLNALDNFIVNSYNIKFNNNNGEVNLELKSR